MTKKTSRTRAVRAGLNTDRNANAVIPPLLLSSAFRREDPAVQPRFDYARTNNPGRCQLAEAIASLEGAPEAITTASGMAAIDLLFHDLPHGARVVCSHDAYGGTRRLLDARAQGGRFEAVYADLTHLDTARAAITPGTALVMAETPSNPRLRIADISALAEISHKAGAELAVDNTVLSPVLQRPIELGADYSVQSITKLINGHSDMVGGVVCMADPSKFERLYWWTNCAGVGGAAFDSYLALRGLRTLPLRAKAQSETALAIAHWLKEDERIAHVDHPGLEDHPGHALAARQQDGFGQLISLQLAGDLCPREVVQRFEIFTLAQSLGGVESLSNIPALMTHAAMTPEARQEAGIPDTLIRLSVGLESASDLIADLDRALRG